LISVINSENRWRRLRRVGDNLLTGTGCEEVLEPSLTL
jgi:hypothetical protein